MPATAAEIGPVYDLLLSTRDGSTLACKNKDGATLNLSQVAFMTSVNPQNVQHEETELQHKDQLVQLASSNLIDREFDQWPQVTQGDWSGGGLQRILTGSTPATSFVPASDPTRYWDGEGLLWPIFDYLPQKPFRGPGVPNAPAAVINKTLAGTIGGWILVNTVNAEPGYAIASFNGVDSFIDYVFADNDAVGMNLFGAGIITDAMCIGGGAIYAAARPDATHVTIYRINATGIATLVVDASLGTGLNINTQLYSASIDAKEVGNHFFVALGITYFNAVLGMKSALVIQDWSQPAGPTASISIDLPNSHGTTGGSMVTDCKILGDSVYVALSDGSTSNKGYNGGQLMAGAGSRTVILQYSIAAGTWATVATIENASGAHICPVAGSLFVLAYASESANTTLSIDMYLLQGGNLQHIGPVFFPSSAWITCSKVSAWGSYAFFGLGQNSQTVNAYHIFAYDVLRGRFFRVHTRSGVVSTNIMVGHMLGVFGSWKKTDASLYTNGIFSQFGIAYDTTVLVQGTGAESFTAELYFNVTPCTSFGGVQLIPPPIQQGSDISSSIVDFTSAQPKLFRQVVLTLQQPGLPSNTTGSVRIKVWLDQDPASLNAVPDFDTGTVANGVGGGVTGQTQIKLLVNRIARKLVYEIITSGGAAVSNNTFVAAPKVSDIAVQAATGWTRTMVLDLAENVITNGKSPGETAWSRQRAPGQPMMDSVAAYNFMRQLWRLKGGEVSAVFPNGDAAADWLLQDIHWDSPKPFGVSFRADQRSQLNYICTVKMREDV